jgi:hypothetical protein
MDFVKRLMGGVGDFCGRILEALFVSPFDTGRTPPEQGGDGITPATTGIRESAF